MLAEAALCGSAAAQSDQQPSAPSDQEPTHGKPLYDSLDNAHKQKFITLGRTRAPERGQFVKAMRHLH
jgi:hypothetical protein